MKAIIAALVVSLLMGHCTERNVLSAPEATSTDSLTIRTGTSFGMCVGYCVADYTLNGTSLTLTQSAQRTQAQNPAKTCQTTLSQADWNALKAAANFETFSKQPERLGCPDCADGGAEYVELQIGNRKHRVTFEYNKTIPGFDPLVNALRTQRNAFKECK